MKYLLWGLLLLNYVGDAYRTIKYVPVLESTKTQADHNARAIKEFIKKR